MQSKCVGCGAILQNKKENEAGFVPKLTEDMKICRRCFRIMHYNELPKIVATNKEYEAVIDSVVSKKALFVFIVDVFSFKSTFHPLMIDRLRGKDVILLANKMDLLPKSSNFSKVVEWISKECERKNFNPLVIGIASAKQQNYIDELISTIDLSRRGRDVYFVGCANVGKSSIINDLLKRTTVQTKDSIATSLVPGTTLNQIRIPYFEDNQALIDTPGLINPSDILNQLLPQSYRTIVPNAEIKPKTYQMTKGNSIFLGGLACLSFSCKEMCSVIVYTSNSLYIHRCKTERVEELFQNQLGHLLVPPLIEEVDHLSYYVKTLDIQGKKCIWFSGFGFVQIYGNARIQIRSLKNSEVYITDAILG